MITNNFDLAELDYLAAKGLLTLELPTYNNCAVLCQQSCEKYLKHLLTISKINVNYINSLGKITNMIMSHDLYRIKEHIVKEYP